MFNSGSRLTTQQSAALMSASALAEGVLPMEKIPEFAIPRMSTPPTIDGRIDAREWREAVAISGVAEHSKNVLIPRPTTFFLGWDDNHLYFAARTYIKPGYKPNTPAGRSEGLANSWDDGLELHFKPMGGNVAADNANSSYKLFLNNLGFKGDCSRLAMGQQYKNWNPRFLVKTSLTEPGTAPNGGRWWELELSSTPEDFELVGKHRVGDEWKFMLGVNHFPTWPQQRIPCVGSYLDPFGYCTGRLVENTPAVQMTMDTLSNLATDGTAAMMIRAFNPTDKPAKLKAVINVADAVKRNEALVVQPGKNAELVLNEKLPEKVKSGSAEVRVLLDEHKLLTYFTYFRVGAYGYYLDPVKPRDPTKFSFSARFNPVRSWLLIKGDTYYLDNPAAAKALRYEVYREGKDKPIVEGRIDRVAEWYFQDVVQLPPLASGKYQVKAFMEMANGKKLGPVSDAFVKKDEAREFAPWWGTKYGDIERVIPPYTAISRSEATISCLGREYELNALGLPAAVRSQDAPVSASPARIIAVVDGKEHTIPLSRGPQFTETTDWRVRFKGRAGGAGLDFTSTGWAEQDGLVYVELTYKPSGRKPVHLDSLRIEYPLSESDADCLLCIGPGANYSSRTTMLLPRDKHGRLWSTLDTGITGSGMTVGSFYPTVWIGSERRGLLWWADNDKGWVQDDAVPAHEAVRKEGAVVLVNNIVAKPVELDRAKTLAVSYIATPFKPLPKGWRTCFADQFRGAPRTFFEPYRGVRKDSKTGERLHDPARGNVNWIHPESRYPEEWGKLWAQQKTEGVEDEFHPGRRWPAADAVVRQWQWRDPLRARSGMNLTNMSFQLMGYGRKTLEDHLYTYFGSEWEAGMDTWNESYTDYAMYLFSRAFSEGGVRATYWDLTFPILFDDLLSGLAYTLPDGRVQRGYNGWNVRRFMMRLWALMYDNGLTPGANSFHSTNAYLTVAMPWTDVVLDGERVWNLDTSPLDWVDNMPIERMRAMSVPHSWGVSITWMAVIQSVDEAKRLHAERTQAQWVWMHDSWLASIEADDVRKLPSIPTSVLDWGINDARTVYHPYWRNPFATCDDKDLLVSLWQLPDRVMLGVFNYNSKQPRDVVLKLDLDALNLVPRLPWQEFVGVRTLWKADAKAPEASLDFHSRKLLVKDLQPHTIRLIGIRRY